MDNNVRKEEFRRAKHIEKPLDNSLDLPTATITKDFDGRGIFRYTMEEPLVAGEHLGRGTYGEVFACHFQNQALALKVAVRTPDKDTAVVDTHLDAAEKCWDLTREFSILSKVGPHPNIVQLYALLTSSTSHRGILMETATLDLLKMVRDLHMDDNEVPLSWALRRAEVTKLFRQTLAGLSYVHSKNIVHLDIKTNNFLVFLPSQRVALSDFGFCRALPVDGQTRVRADEVYAAYYRPIECLYAVDKKASI